MNTIDTFNTFVATHLNNAQRQAVNHESGSLLVIAGAGSGKTRVITARITNLILNHQVNPSSIIALTFTNKAANEMKERITHFLGSEKTLPFVGTFHAYCVRLLKQYRNLLPVAFETILDADDQQKIIKNILKKNGLQKQFSEKNVLYQISQIKNRSIAPEVDIAKYNEPLLLDIYKKYEQEKLVSKCLDFDDLLLYCLKLLKNETFQLLHQQRVRHLLVDEYQDTNVVQHELLKLMSLRNHNLIIDSLCAVGDEDQSIYSWRGATVTNIRNFSQDFSDTTIVKIEQNYRSIQEVLDVANHVIVHNKTHTPKKLWSEKHGTNRIHVLNFASEYQEADAIARALTLIQTHDQKKLSDVAILYRTHAQSRALEEALIKLSIPYRIIGGVQFYDRMEIRDLLAYLKLIVNPYDRISCARIINVPARTLGQKSEEQFFTIWDQQPLEHFKEIAQRLMDDASITQSKKHALFSFISIFDDITPDTVPSQALQNIIERTRYVAYIKDAYEKEEATERLANIDELVHACEHFQESGTNTIQQLLENIALMQDYSAQAAHEKNAVLLMTLHAAKGLEFDTVIISGLEEGIFPTSRSLYVQESIEEERRLFYVGITRARERLLLTCAKHRHTYGHMTEQQRSRFLDDIPSKTIPRHDSFFWRNHDTITFFSQWFGLTTIGTIKQPAPLQVKSTSSASLKHRVTATQQVSAESPSSGVTDWRINQPVKHTQFGIGIIKKIEQRSHQTFVEVAFKTGTKKISADFLSKV